MDQVPEAWLHSATILYPEAEVQKALFEKDIKELSSLDEEPYWMISITRLFGLQSILHALDVDVLTPSINLNWIGIHRTRHRSRGS